VQHFLGARQFSWYELERILALAEVMREMLESPAGRRELADRHKGRIVATLFFEPSTRTRLSFESAAHRLGINVISTENAREHSSAAKGETIEDTVRIVESYADAIIMRHHENGTAERAAAVSSVPIINAGDGTGEHPTQGLLDVFTVKREKGRLDNLRVVAGGDLANGRTVRSFIQMLALYPGNEITFISTPELQMGEDVLNYLDQNKVRYTKTNSLKGSIESADVVYWTRLQKERLSNSKLESGFVIDEDVLSVMRKDAIIMHPLPRVDEITAAVDKDPRAAYFRQAKNGVYIRMALLDLALS
jgi:aspartate carbamoyltransferase catalytic subunit